jgi:hypothetical protein
MRKLRLRKKMLTFVALLYAAILAASVTFAAVTGQIDFTGYVITSADLDVRINPMPGGLVLLPATSFGSVVTSATPCSCCFRNLTIEADLRAPGDAASMTFQFQNFGALPAEFDAIVVEVHGGVPVFAYDSYGVLQPVLDSNGDQVYDFPVVIEGFAEAGEIVDFEDIDGYRLEGGIGELSSRFGLAIVWDEDIHHVTHPDGPSGPGTPISFTIEFPFAIGDIAPPPTPTPYPVPTP